MHLYNQMLDSWMCISSPRDIKHRKLIYVGRVLAFDGKVSVNDPGFFT